jgi:hypothetical protein
MALQTSLNHKDSMSSEYPAGLPRRFSRKLLRVVPRRLKRSSGSFRLLPPRQPPTPPAFYHTQDSPFLNLPREIRDLIYHHYWTLHPHLSASRAQALNAFSMRLHYEGRNSADNPDTRPIYWNMPRVKEKTSCPSLGLSSKQILYEALEQYERRAEWYWSATITSKPWHLPLGLQVNSGRVGKVTIWVDDLLTSDYVHHTSLRDNIVCEIVLRKYLYSGLPLQRLRIAGCLDTSQWSHTEFGEHSYVGGAAAIAHNVLTVFGRAVLPRLELEIFNAEKHWRRRIFYEVRREGSDVYLHTLDFERRGMRVIRGREGWSWTSEEGVRVESDYGENPALSEHPQKVDWDEAPYAVWLRWKRRTEAVGGRCRVARDELLVYTARHGVSNTQHS